MNKQVYSYWQIWQSRKTMHHHLLLLRHIDSSPLQLDSCLSFAALCPLKQPSSLSSYSLSCLANAKLSQQESNQLKLTRRGQSSKAVAGKMNESINLPASQIRLSIYVILNNLLKSEHGY